MIRGHCSRLRASHLGDKLQINSIQKKNARKYARSLVWHMRTVDDDVHVNDNTRNDGNKLQKKKKKNVYTALVARNRANAGNVRELVSSSLHKVTDWQKAFT